MVDSPNHLPLVWIEVAPFPDAAVPFQFVAAQIGLAGVVFGSGNDARFVGYSQRILNHLLSGAFRQMLEDIPKEDYIVARHLLDQFTRISDVYLIINKTMHVGDVGGEAFDPVAMSAVTLVGAP